MVKKGLYPNLNSVGTTPLRSDVGPHSMLGSNLWGVRRRRAHTMSTLATRSEPDREPLPGEKNADGGQRHKESL
jgi:hypothetical protein